MIVLIDNYDSFTYNLVHYLGELGVEVSVYRNDKITPEQVVAIQPEAIMLSPGPCTPDDAGICLDLVRYAGGKVPLFGVCLGQQAIAQAFGGRIVRAQQLMHGKLSTIRHFGGAIFRDIPDAFTATRYHSLTVDPSQVPDCLRVTAKDEGAVIMALEHKEMPIHSVQFHPESIASEYGHQILQNFVDLARRWGSRAAVK